MKNFLIGILLSSLLVACDSRFDDDIPMGLEIEKKISSDSTFIPTCYALTVKITEASKQAFMANPDQYNMGRSGKGLLEWSKTPVPERFLIGGDTLESRSASIGTYCGGYMSDTISDYNKVFFDAAESTGSYYTFTDYRDTMILIKPDSNLLFYMYHD